MHQVLHSTATQNMQVNRRSLIGNPNLLRIFNQNLRYSDIDGRPFRKVLVLHRKIVNFGITVVSFNLQQVFEEHFLVSD